MALALSAHCEARSEFENTKASFAKGRGTRAASSRHELQNEGMACLHRCVRKNQTLENEDLWVGLSSLVGMFVWDDSASTWDDESLHLAEYAVGQVELTINNKRRTFDAFVAKYCGPMLVIAAKWGDIRDAKLGPVTWYHTGSILQYVRRFSGIEENRIAPALHDALWQRDTKLRRRPRHELDEVKRVYESYLGERSSIDSKRRFTGDQLELVWTAVAHLGIVLARGPFGCGKSWVIAAIVAILVRVFPGRRILVVSEANGAIEQNARRVLQECKVHPTQMLKIGRKTTDRNLEKIDLQSL